MNVPYFKCQDCGHEFERTEYLPDVEDALVSCPVCDGLDIHDGLAIQLVEEPAAERADLAA
jgi:predicted nucleic acid-binding Zn ribbon protein